MTDRIVLRNIRVDGRHGVGDDERATPQPFEVDVELLLDLRPAGVADDLDRTVDYREVDAIVREVIGGRSVLLLETLAETIGRRVIAETAVDDVIVRVRKPTVRLGGPIDWSGVEIRRSRETPSD